MKRSKNQAVYKYLPEMWASEKDGTGRSVTARIKNWNYRKMENIYGGFINGEIKRQIGLFAARGGDVGSFYSGQGKQEFCIVEPACNQGIPDIVGEVSPLVFYCSSCKRTFQKHNSRELNRSIWQCPVCKKDTVKQLQMVYSCECGFAQPVAVPYVKGIKDLYYKPNENQYRMYYMRGNNEKAAELAILCPACHARLVLDNAESNRNYKPFSLSIINLVDKKSGAFFEKGEGARKVVIAKWLEQLSQEDYDKLLDNMDLAFSESTTFAAMREEAKRQANMLISCGLAKAEDFDSIVGAMLKSKEDGVNVEKYINACDRIFSRRRGQDPEGYDLWANYFSFKLMQYNTIKYAKRVITLKDSIDRQIEMGFIGSAAEVEELHRKMGISGMQASCDIEIINCTYGFTRKVADPKNSTNCRLKLVSFDKSKDNGANLVYGAKLETEGILFEINRRRILEWLFINNIVREEQLPDLEDQVSMKKWFAEYVHGELVNQFGEMGEEDRITKHVFALLHSISHAFIKTAGELSGLSGNSLSEIIMVETTSIFIYAQTSQGLPLGALSGMAETNYVNFLASAFNETRNCIFDPICTERDDTRCSACLVIPEISCSHFNSDLGRKYLYTLTEIDGKPFTGFWETE